MTTLAPSPAADTRTHDLGVLVLRVIVGGIMAVHGTQKLFGWFGGHGLDGAATGFAAMGYPAAKAMATLAAVIETFGGLALIVGLLTPLAAAAIVGNMLNAVVVKWDGGFFAPNGYEYELLLTVAAAALALTGPGAIAVDRFVPVLRRHRLGYGVAALVLALVTGVIFALIRN
ncbi:DoxX family protein [Nocardia stercoris]|uniref:DoxX family protein n=1 Tax=Nocardia stercoris TaxID=2483361 RepID=A0A3M2L7G9_9NOCA|nr:DoxX family protein [Nocardia stercoris]RMI33294.1 DoxX family protein [Nocardia stercoris]